MVYIVGLGPGGKEYILPAAIKRIESAQMCIGFKRALQSISFLCNEGIEVRSIAEVIDILQSNKEKEIAVIASGDPLFYGITNYIKSHYEGKIEVIPGVSSFQYFMARLAKPWQGGFLGSVHGRKEDFLQKVEENPLSIWLTGTDAPPQKLCEQLVFSERKVKVYVGENLSYEDEKITEGTPAELINLSFEALSIVVVEHL